ncbi:hypothetical protein AB0N92_04245 [Streptomyces sp. NPDC093248]|uniref:hypothetical protein n=1 Tax=Streptomyces sp. NPDC093248 TaxID=3155072 RepID=UPI00344A4F59
MAENRLRFILDGDDRLSRVLNRAGESSARLRQRLTRDMDDSSRSVDNFVRSADGRFRDLRGRFLSAEEAQRRMAAGLPVVTGRLGELGDASSDAAGSLGRGGGLSGAMMGVAAAAGISLLPAIGALVPMLAGAGVAAGTLKMGFSGVGDAMKLADTDQKKYRETLKKMGPEQREFTKSLVGLKKEFGPIGREVQKSMLPGFTKAVKDAAPVVKILGRAMSGMGKQFGDAAAGVGRMMKDSGFQKDLQANLKLGAGFVKDMTSAMGPFTRSLLDFGAASGPTLKAFSDGIGGLLSKGLPDMFAGLKAGIPGTAKMLDGLFSAVNDILGGLGRLGGEFGRTLGPVFGQSFKISGDIIAGAMDTIRGAMVLLRPLFVDLTFGLKTIRDVGRIVGPTLADAGRAIVGAFLPVGDSVSSSIGPLQRMNLWVQNNKQTVLEWGRLFGVAMIDVTSAAISAAPTVIKMFRYISMAALASFDVIISGAAHAFGWIPGIGGKLKAANKAFDTFKDGYLRSLETAERKANEFAASAGPKLSAGKLKLNISNWQSQIEAAKAKLRTVPPSKQAALRATIADLQAKVAAARRSLDSLNGKTATTYVRTVRLGGSSPFHGKEVPIATGGLFTGSGVRHRGYASGGLVDGPGSETSDSIFAPWLSKNEFVVNARRTRQYLPLLQAINTGRLGTGGGTGGMGMDAGRGLASGLVGAMGSVQAAAARMAAAVTAGVKAELEIASPSKKMKALAKDIGKGLIIGLTGSRDKIKATAKDLATDIRTAFSGRKESNLLKYVDRQTDKLLKYASKRDKIAARIAEAKDFAHNTTHTAKESAGLANLGMDSDHITAGGIKAGLASKLSKIRQFTKYIDILAKRGLHKSLLKQILNMGPDAGYAYASALVGADKGTLKQINSLQSTVNKSSDRLGKLGADRLYDSGKAAGKGFLKGLEAQQKHIENLMMKIAKGMQKAIKKALGIKSPSTVMAQLGVYSTQGLARGLVDGMPHLDRALSTVSGRVADTRPVIGKPATAAAGGWGPPVQITIEGALDPYAVARQVETVLAKYKRGRGGASYNFG